MMNLEPGGSQLQLSIEATNSFAREEAAARTISAELLAYIGLALIALMLRITALGSVPISDFEAVHALHAWHTIEDDAPGQYMVSSSPLTYITQLITFSTLGASEFAARIGSAFAGFALALAPLLFRDSLGRTRTFVWAALLSLLTVPIALSRVADGTAFMMLFTLMAIWMIRRYWYSRQLSDALMAIAFVTFMVLLASPSGIPLLVILLVSGWMAVWRTALSAPERLDLPGDDILRMAVRRLHDFPFAKVAFVPLLVVGITATLFMLNPAGLRTVSHLAGEAISGITQSRAIDGARLGFVALLTYEPLLIIYALGGAWLLWKKGDITYVDRFAAAWAALGAVGLLLYPGARPADAMWVVLPLTLLASYGITQLMVNRRVVVLWSSSDEEEDEGELYSTRYWWAKWVISAGVFMFLLILSVQFMQVARLMLDLPADTGLAAFFPLLLESSQFRLLQGLGLLAVTAVIAFILFLLVANFWGLGTCLQGTGLGFLWVLLLSGPGGAWQSAVSGNFEANDVWRQSAVTEDAYLLRETLFELADRDTAGFPLLEFYVVAYRSGVVRDDGLVAWLTRDFPNARFVNTVEEAAGEQIVLMAQDEDLAASLGGAYVGQRFVLRRNWSVAQLEILDLPAWWSQGRLRAGKVQEQALVLWLRQDVYDGIPLEERP